jgi:hypothetical protein
MFPLQKKPAAQFLFLCFCALLPVLSNSKENAAPKPEKWKLVKNMEQVEYCLSLPLAGFWEDYKENDERAKHVFIKSKSKTMLTVSGLLRSENKSITEYFNEYFDEERNAGKAIEQKKLNTEGSKFYCYGYYSNFIYRERFIEVLWLRKDELVKLELSFPVKDTAIWYSRINRLFKQNANCTN